MLACPRQGCQRGFLILCTFIPSPAEPCSDFWSHTHRVQVVPVDSQLWDYSKLLPPCLERWISVLEGPARPISATRHPEDVELDVDQHWQILGVNLGPGAAQLSLPPGSACAAQQQRPQILVRSCPAASCPAASCPSSSPRPEPGTAPFCCPFIGARG